MGYISIQSRDNPARTLPILCLENPSRIVNRHQAFVQLFGTAPPQIYFLPMTRFFRFFSTHACFPAFLDKIGEVGAAPSLKHMEGTFHVRISDTFFNAKATEGQSIMDTFLLNQSPYYAS